MSSSPPESTALDRRTTATWLGLVALTCATTWGMRTDFLSPAPAVTGTFVMAAAKVAVVMQEFMELRHGHWPVRAVFTLWILAVVTVILTFWLLTPAIDQSH